MSPRIGSLFSGTGALDLAVQAVFGGDVVWHCQYEPPDKNGREDKNQYAAKILARHWPTVPNLGDVTALDWHAVIEEHGPVDIVTGGFPCTDVSSAGQRAGLTPDTRSGLWTRMAHAVSILQPKLVVIENVEGLLSAPADRGLGLDAEALEKEARAGRILRALGAVLGDLASLGFHAEWARVAASEVGAPHGRKRVFIYAWPTAVDPRRFRWGHRPGLLSGMGAAGRDAEAPADTADLGHERGGDTRRRGPGPADGSVDAADTSGSGREGRGVRGRSAVDGESAATDAESVGHGPRRLSVREGTAIANARVGRKDAADTDNGGCRANVLELRPGQPDLDWGDYGPAIRRWEQALGRPAPWPTDALGRLSPVFTEWLMGLPDGWVTDTPGLTRPAMLRALGNGVVPQQAIAALWLLHERVTANDQQAAA